MIHVSDVKVGVPSTTCTKNKFMNNKISYVYKVANFCFISNNAFPDSLSFTSSCYMYHSYLNC